MFCDGDRWQETALRGTKAGHHNASVWAALTRGGRRLVGTDARAARADERDARGHTHGMIMRRCFQESAHVIREILVVSLPPSILPLPPVG
eukprot:4261751-Pyramimonas_sp.AAC.1